MVKDLDLGNGCSLTQTEVWCTAFLSFNIFFCHCRNLLHHFPLYLCCRHQLRAFPLPTVSVRPARWHWPWLRMVHVLRLGRPRPYPHCRLLLHPSSLRPADTQIYLPQVPTGERHRLLKMAAMRRPTHPTDQQQRNRKTIRHVHPSTHLQSLLVPDLFFLNVCVFKNGCLDDLLSWKYQKKTEELTKYYHIFWSRACFVVVRQTIKWTMTTKGCKGNTVETLKDLIHDSKWL